MDTVKRCRESGQQTTNRHARWTLYRNNGSQNLWPNRLPDFPPEVANSFVVVMMMMMMMMMIREWLRYCRKVYWTKRAQNGPNNILVKWPYSEPILAFARSKWTCSIVVHLGPPTVLWPFLNDDDDDDDDDDDHDDDWFNLELCWWAH